MQDSTVMRAFSGQQLDKMNAEEQARKEAQEVAETEDIKHTA